MLLQNSAEIDQDALSSEEEDRILRQLDDGRLHGAARAFLAAQLEVEGLVAPHECVQVTADTMRDRLANSPEVRARVVELLAAENVGLDRRL